MEDNRNSRRDRRLTMRTLTLTPAYGRDYKSQAAVLKDFLDEKDFIVQPEGRYINKQQIPRGAIIKFRYSNMEQEFIVEV